MHAIVVATADEELRSRVVQQLATEGRAATYCATWSDTLSKLTKDRTKLLLIDGDLPGASGEVLEMVRRSVPHSPTIRAIRSALPPIEMLRSLTHFSSLAHSTEKVIFSDRERKLVELIGLGPEPHVTLHNLVHSPMPIRVQGERGTGKEWVAKTVHRMIGEERPFVVLYPGTDPQVRDSIPGTLYIENLEDHRSEIILSALTLAEATKWRVMAGSRHPHDPKREGMSWTHVLLRPLRDRPKDIRPLSRLYLDDYRRRLGLPPRRVAAALWDRMERYPWPGNHRELETFLVQASTSARGSNLSLETLPRRVLALLDAHHRERGDRQAFEEIVEASLRPVVSRYEPSPEAPTLYQLVIDATERALIRAALGRTAGNQKGAAELLGLSRNTLRERMERLDPLNEER